MSPEQAMEELKSKPSFVMQNTMAEVVLGRKLTEEEKMCIAVASVSTGESLLEKCDGFSLTFAVDMLVFHTVTMKDPTIQARFQAKHEEFQKEKEQVDFTGAM